MVASINVATNVLRNCCKVVGCCSAILPLLVEIIIKQLICCVSFSMHKLYEMKTWIISETEIVTTLSSQVKLPLSKRSNLCQLDTLYKVNKRALNDETRTNNVLIPTVSRCFIVTLHSFLSCVSFLSSFTYFYSTQSFVTLGTFQIM